MTIIDTINDFITENTPFLKTAVRYMFIAALILLIYFVLLLYFHEHGHKFAIKTSSKFLKIPYKY